MKIVLSLLICLLLAITAYTQDSYDVYNISRESKGIYLTHREGTIQEGNSYAINLVLVKGVKYEFKFKCAEYITVTIDDVELSLLNEENSIFVEGDNRPVYIKLYCKKYTKRGKRRETAFLGVYYHMK